MAGDKRHYQARYYWGVNQGSDKWYKLRKGRIGGSTISPLTVVPKAKDKLLSAGCYTLAEQAAAEHRGCDPDRYISKDMEWGMMHEPDAREAYEKETGRMVMDCGYITYGKYFGVSLDGAVMADDMVTIDRVIEIKCPKPKNFIAFEKRGEYDKKYYAQGQWQLYITGASILDLVFFHPKLGVAIRTYEPDKEIFAKFHERIKPMEELIARFEVPGVVPLANV